MFVIKAFKNLRGVVCAVFCFLVTVLLKHIFALVVSVFRSSANIVPTKNMPVPAKSPVKISRKIKKSPNHSALTASYFGDILQYLFCFYKPISLCIII